MKRFKELNGSTLLAVSLPLLLIVPNVALCVTERMGLWSSLTNIFLPLSIYFLLMSLWKRTGIATLLMLPFMAYAGFQIVLLYLYGGSIIAVDMFLNVVTTNATEVGELLGNLVFAIAVVIILYIPPLVSAVVLIFKHGTLPFSFMRKLRQCSVIAVICSCIMLSITILTEPKYKITRDLFPVNVISNMCRAIERTIKVSNYEETSRNFTYDASSSHPADMPEVYLLVIGETSRGENWQLLGYDRETNPELSQSDSLIIFRKAVTQSNTTHKSVPMIISSLTAENFDSITHHKSMITAFKESGFHTYLFSNQTRNRSYTEHFCNEADELEYIKERLGRGAMDHELLKNLAYALSDTTYIKKFIILHTYGSHFNYRDRYTEDFAIFTPDNYTDANLGNRPLLVNSFDNTIRYIDSFLAQAILLLNESGIPAVMIYTSDHGEDIFDDSRHRFLHASPTPTFHQLYVPMIAWLSGEYIMQFSDSAYINLKKNSDFTISTTVSVFPTMVDLAGISTPYLKKDKSLSGNGFSPAPLLYITDLNEAVPLMESGITENDIELFNDKHININ